jgi:RNase adaptor protein for sRNA GlmZ degradation
MNKITLVSFGYLHGEPPKADVTIDLREMLSDPVHRPEGDMLDMTGLDEEVASFVFATPGAYKLVNNLFRLVKGVAEIKPIKLAIGCAGGRHRSVAVVEEIRWLLYNGEQEVEYEHLHVHLPRVIRKEK